MIYNANFLLLFIDIEIETPLRSYHKTINLNQEVVVDRTYFDFMAEAEKSESTEITVKVNFIKSL